jgi:DNA-binding Lrp family transcriptional regulator
MLEQLLAEIRAGGALEASKLAARLNTTPQMVEALLEHLQRAGVLRAYETACSDGCDGCRLKGFCAPDSSHSSVQIWQYDDKNSAKEVK